MNNKFPAGPRADGIDAERFRAMVESEAFGRLWTRLGAELRRASRACELAETEVELRRAQGATAALRTAQGLPQAILAEMRKL